MNAFLVLLRHTMDDFPLFLAETLDAAEAFIDAAKWDAPDWSKGSTPVSLCIVEFKDGLPVGRPEEIRRFDIDGKLESRA